MKTVWEHDVYMEGGMDGRKGGYDGRAGDRIFEISTEMVKGLRPQAPISTYTTCCAQSKSFGSNGCASVGESSLAWAAPGDRDRDRMCGT